MYKNFFFTFFLFEWLIRYYLYVTLGFVFSYISFFIIILGFYLQLEVAETKTQSWKRGKETFHFIPINPGSAPQHRDTRLRVTRRRPRQTIVKPNYFDNIGSFGRKRPGFAASRPRPTYVKPNQQVYFDNFKKFGRKNPNYVLSG